MELLTVRAAQRRIAGIVAPIGTERVLLAQALGRVLAAEIDAVDLPLFDNSSVDGFAVVAGGLNSAGPSKPRLLKVVTDIPAGAVSRKRLRQGEAARIMTGAPVPRNATAVIMLEDTDQMARGGTGQLPELIRAYRWPKPGENIRRRGSDVRRGRRVLNSGHRLRPQDLGVLGMLGRSHVLVYRMPRIALFSSGNELTAPGKHLRPGAIRDTNTITLGALISEMGCEIISLGVARDDRRAIVQLLSRASSRHADLILSSAGVSVGAFDFVRQAIQEEGQLEFWRVNVRPGKPLAVGRYRGIPWIGLPGNPVSAFVGFELFVKPALARLCGLRSYPRQVVRVSLGESIKSDGRESYLRVVVEEKKGRLVAHLTGHQGSGNLLSLVQANALLMVPAGVKSLAAGAQANAWLL